MGKTAPLSTKQAYDRGRYRRLKAEREASREPDPITTLTPEERAYLAGLIDGEGSIYIAAVGPNRGRSVYAIVTVAMTHRPVIDWLADRTKAGTVKLHNHSNLRQHPHYRPQYRWQLFGKRARLLCETLLPYLRVKAEQARLVTTFPCDARVGPGVRLDPEVNRARYDLRDTVNALNH